MIEKQVLDKEIRKAMKATADPYITTIELHDEPKDEINEDDELDYELFLASMEVEEDDPTNDPVNHPNHYIHGKYETIEVLKDWMNATEFEGFCTGNALKYLSRWRMKGGVEDLEKAARYLNYLLDWEGVNDD